MTFAMVLPNRPPSGNRGPNRFFQETVREAARRRFMGREPLSGSLYVRINWFHRLPTTQDIDNIAKNILDALKGTVFSDDVVIAQCLACKIDTGRDYAIDTRGAPADVMEELLLLLGEDRDHVLYIEVGAVASNTVTFGPIDGGTI